MIIFRESTDLEGGVGGVNGVRGDFYFCEEGMCVAIANIGERRFRWQEAAVADGQKGDATASPQHNCQKKAGTVKKDS